MAVYRLFRSQPFEPEVISIMSGALSDVCRTLGVNDRDHRRTNVVAKKVIEYAQRGVRDHAGLRDRVLQALRN
ncbi:MAG TPA: hypothetical protein VMJ52_13765 [Xanthobacteraceae bacterium]|nr:hypothetical protein [Xanthobacteraceae bacterium]